MHRTAHRITRNAVDEVYVTSTTPDTTVDDLVRVNTQSNVATASVLPGYTTADASTPLHPAMLIQIFLGSAMVIGFITFFVTRHMRYKRVKKRDEERAMNAALFAVISAPNGLGGPKGSVPPPYYEALKSHRQYAGGSVNTTRTSTDQWREKSNSMVVDECWRAVYAAEESTGVTASSARNSMQLQTMATAQPASPRGVEYGEMRQSVSRWFRNQKWMPSKATDGAGPLPSNPLFSNPTITYYSEDIKHLPVPPTPSYTGVHPTPSAAGSLPPTPDTATFLAPGGAARSPYSEPLSARSWLTGDDRLSIRASIPNSVLYPSPLQPAPPPKRQSSHAPTRESLISQSEYDGASWKTITPADDAPRYEWEPRASSRSSLATANAHLW